MRYPLRLLSWMIVAIANDLHTLAEILYRSAVAIEPFACGCNDSRHHTS